MANNIFNQLCVWPGVIVGESNISDFTSFFEREMGVRVRYLTEIETRPDLDGKGREVKGTGGRNDVFFHVHEEDIPKFAVPRLSMGIRWWEDVIVYNDSSHLYPEEFLEANPPKW